MPGLYGAMLANYQNVAEQFTDCTSVSKEWVIDFGSEGLWIFSQSGSGKIMPNPEVNPPVEIIAG
ncbi:MAG: hypothetical protein K2L38_02025 [Dysosmobacter sp.]|nr:hypothetical protein [Dysosmobacter sp.]